MKKAVTTLTGVNYLSGKKKLYFEVIDNLHLLGLKLYCK